MNLRLPPHIAWPLFVIGLLSMSIVAVVLTVVLARSDGGAQVVDDYYQKAVRWDETAARQAASDALGWQVTVTLSASAPQGPDRPVTFSIRDRDGNPVDHLLGTVYARRPHRSGVVAEQSLDATPDTPGTYHAAFILDTPGLWDFEIVATRDTLHFETVIRKDLSF